jgi:hypothetical protein
VPRNCRTWTCTRCSRPEPGPTPKPRLNTSSILALEWLAVIAAGAALAGWLGQRRLRQARELGDTPLSRVRSAAQGEVDLLGRARLMPGPEIITPLTGTPCVWWRCRVWHTVDKDTEVIYDATSDDLFYLSDTTGDCIVDPVGAQVEPSVSRTWRGHLRKPLMAPRSDWDALFTFGAYRYSEQYIARDTLLTARGWFRTQAAVQAADESRDLAALLGEWKRDRAGLLRRFDADHNGTIDAQEWEVARAAALEEIRAQREQQGTLPDLNVLGKPPDERDFLLSAMSRQLLEQRLRRRGWSLLAVSAAAGLAALWTLHAHGWL